MEQIKELTKRLIANSFKELLMQLSFDKITIKMITDHANVIRPTFYNHFHDKYELVEWILQDEILTKGEALLLEGRGGEGIKTILTGFYADKEYYRKAFDINGQNGFGETLHNRLTDVFSKVVEAEKVKTGKVSTRLMAQYYAAGLMTVIRYILFESGDDGLTDILDMYKYLMEHTIYEIM